MFTLLLLLLPLVSTRNILVVLLDDVDYQPKTLSLGLPNVTTHFRNNGVIYNNAFVTTPICCPSRASILTGTYQHNHRLEPTVGYEVTPVIAYSELSQRVISRLFSSRATYFGCTMFMVIS